MSAAAANGFKTYSRGDRLDQRIQENTMQQKVTAKIGGNEIFIETGKIARLADGAVIVTCWKREKREIGRRKSESLID